jgi:hypothetical protein
VLLSITLLAGGVSLVSAADPQPATRPATTKPHGEYMCPMCKTSSDKPGKCPDCGMEMRKSDDAKKHADDVKKHAAPYDHKAPTTQESPPQYRHPIDPHK